MAADAKNLPLALADLGPDGHIHFLHAAREAAGQDAAAAIYAALERQACETGVPRLYAEAREAARRFFLK